MRGSTGTPGLEDDDKSWEVAAVLGGGSHPHVGTFQYFLDDQRWVWSDTIARIHGYLPGQVQPTTDLLLSHKHPDDRAKVAEILHRVQAGGPFSSRHRIIDTHGATHWVVVVGDQMMDDSGEVVGTEGFYIDVTDGLQSDITTETSRILKSRSIIDQAKGVLMVAYGIDDARAFEVLKLSSQLAQVELATVARQFLDAIRSHGLPPETVRTIDRLLVQTRQSHQK